MSLLPALLAFVCALLPAAAAGQKEKAKPAPLTEEEREILRNRELLENLDLLRNLEKVKYIDFLVEKKEDKAKEKQTSKSAAKDNAGKKIH